MISSKLKGGIGNQLFQIAAAVSLSINNGDRYAFNFDDPIVMQGNSASTYRDNVYSRLPELSKEWKPQYYWYENNEYYHPIVYRENTLLDGYFQTEKYFHPNARFIIDLFLNKQVIDKLRHEYMNVLSNSVSIHVRRGDYVKLNESMDKDYYFKAFELLWGEKEIDNILVFSDDIEWCKVNILPRDFRVKYIQGNRDYEDLYLMSLCENNIVGNSSFSWWGAYLNRNKNKMVYMPNPWTTSIYEDIYPSGTIIVKR